jgi:membrane fusion protein, heavy metal efflux system
MRTVVRWALFGLSLLAMGCRSKAPPDSEATPRAPSSETELTVDPALLSSGRIATSVIADSKGGANLRVPGEVVPAPNGEAEVGALVSGRLAELLRHEGERVKKGTILAWIDAPEVGMARAEMLRIQAGIDLADKKLSRAQRLSEQNAIAPSALEEADASLGAAKAERGAILARLAALGASGGAGSKVPVLAPIDGEIVERFVTLGSAVDAGRPLMRIISDVGLRVRTQFPAAITPLPAQGDSVTLEPRSVRAGSGQTCPAEVLQVSASMEPSSRTLTLYLSPSQKCSFLRPYEPIEVIFTRVALAGSVPTEIPVMVPRDALIDIRGVPTVFVAGAQPGKFRAVAVSVQATLGSSAILRSGVLPGQTVVVRGAILLKGEMLKEVLGGE